ncbi:MAG: hypothetical protein IKS22_01340 [Bacteroidales bacterium]|nr:hypothetical protein [Bacteroidales bacterium]
MKRQIISILTAILSVLVLNAQEQNFAYMFDFGERINRYNSKGQKEGIWVETFGKLYHFRFYRDGGKRSLVLRWVPAKNYIESILDIEDDNIISSVSVSSGVMSREDVPGKLDYISFSSINKEFYFHKYDGSLQRPYYKSYEKSFYPDGQVSSEGYLVWDKGWSPEIDSFHSGVRKSYDKEGNVKVSNVRVTIDESGSFDEEWEDIEDSSIVSVTDTLGQDAGGMFDFGMEINRYDHKGLKDGLWIDDSTVPDHIVYTPYINGNKDGLSFSVRLSTNTLDWIDYSINGDPKVIIFFNTGVPDSTLGTPGTILMMYFCSINKTYKVKKPDGSVFIPYYKAYYKDFHPNGLIKSEGFTVWEKNADMLTDYWDCGEWKYYDEEGKVTIRNYPDGRH